MKEKKKKRSSSQQQKKKQNFFFSSFLCHVYSLSFSIFPNNFALYNTATWLHSYSILHSIKPSQSNKYFTTHISCTPHTVFHSCKCYELNTYPPNGCYILRMKIHFCHFNEKRERTKNCISKTIKE